MEEFKIEYTGKAEDFTREELRIITTLADNKELIEKIIDKLTYKLQVEMLNETITSQEVRGFKRACSVFLSIFKK